MRCPESFDWGIDYETNPAGNFNKTTMGNLLAILKIDNSILPNLLIILKYLLNMNMVGTTRKTGISGTETELKPYVA